MAAMFLSRTSIYEKDYACVMRNPDCEFNQGAHYHDFYEIDIYFSDAGVLTLGNKEYELHSGDITLINIFSPHLFLPTEKSYERFSISVDPSFLLSVCSEKSNLLNLFSPANKNFPVLHPGYDDFKKIVDSINEYELTRFEHGHDLLERALIYKILAYLYNLFFDGNHVNYLESRHVDIIAQMIRFISAHLNEDLPLERISTEVNFSIYHICRIFKKYTGYTITNYIISNRIERAKYLLKDNNPIEKVSQEVGFNNYCYFYKAFKKITGCSPTDYKKSNDKM